jgi:hypothetical protein
MQHRPRRMSYRPRKTSLSPAMAIRPAIDAPCVVCRARAAQPRLKKVPSLPCSMYCLACAKSALGDVDLDSTALPRVASLLRRSLRTAHMLGPHSAVQRISPVAEQSFSTRFASVAVQRSRCFSEARGTFKMSCPTPRYPSGWPPDRFEISSSTVGCVKAKQPGVCVDA